MSFSSKFILSEDYPEIRDHLGGVSEDVISPSDIEKSSYLQRADAEVISECPEWDSADDNTDRLALRKLQLKIATICLTASYLIPKVQELKKSEQIDGDYAYTNLTPAEWDAKATSLRNSAAQAIARANATIETAEPEGLISSFRLAGPSRSRCDD